MTDEQAAVLAAVMLLAPHMDPRDLEHPTGYTTDRINAWAAVLLDMLGPILPRR
jgi:hypothetical protein